jgi:hypothetical protein
MGTGSAQGSHGFMDPEILMDRNAWLHGDPFRKEKESEMPSFGRKDPFDATTIPYGTMAWKINGGQRHVPFQINLCPGVELPEGGVDPEVSSGGGAAE